MLQSVIERGAQLANGSLQPILEETCSQVEIHDGVICRGLEALAEACALVFQRLVQRLEDGIQGAGNLALAACQALADLAGTGNQRLVEQAGALGKRGIELFRARVERRGTGFKIPQDFTATRGKRGIQVFKAAVEFIRQAGAGRSQRLDETFRLGGQKRAQSFACCV